MKSIDITLVRSKTLEYIERLRLKKKPYGQYRYREKGTNSILYASVYAAMTRHLYNDFQNIKEYEKKEWIDYLQSFQDEDGLFKDPAVADSNFINYDWWGWRHLTCHVIVALCALGATVKKEFVDIKPFYDPDYVKKWLSDRNWLTPANSNNAGNEILNYGTLLQYARDFHNDEKAKKSVEVLLDWLWENQNPQYGAWGPNIDLKNKVDLAEVMMGGYHEFLLFFYDKRPLKYKEVIIDRILSLQNEKGGFVGPHHPISSACQDIDCMDPLARLTDQIEYRRDEIKDCLRKAVSCVLNHQNKDGGFVFYQDKEFMYGHPEMFSSNNESSMFATWFRTLSVAIVGQVLCDSIVGNFDWQFTKCPGFQFWRGGKKQ